MSSICPLCQQPIIKHGKNKSCECDFEKHLEYLRELDCKDYREECNKMYSSGKINFEKESKTVSKPNLQINRFKNVR